MFTIPLVLFISLNIKALLKVWVGLYFSILLMEKTKQSMAKWLSRVMTSEGWSDLGTHAPKAGRGDSLGQFLKPWLCLLFLWKHILCKCLSRFYSLKVTASSKLVLSLSFFVSTHLPDISGLEKYMQTNQPLKVSGAEYEIFLLILLIVAYSQS